MTYGSECPEWLGGGEETPRLMLPEEVEREWDKFLGLDLRWWIAEFYNPGGDGLAIVGFIDRLERRGSDIVFHLSRVQFLDESTGVDFENQPVLEEHEKLELLVSTDEAPEFGEEITEGIFLPGTRSYIDLTSGVVYPSESP